MPGLNIHVEGDNCWMDLLDRQEDIIHLNDPLMAIAGLPGGMKSGLPSVAIRIDLPDGRVVIAETSMRLFITAARALYARYASELGEPPL